VEGHLMSDHVHICIAIPPKYPIASVTGFLKGRAPLRRPDSPAKNATSRANTSGLAAMRFPPSASNSSKSADASATSYAALS
jgi:REP element-mobilizing transposase RayT